MSKMAAILLLAGAASPVLAQSNPDEWSDSRLLPGPGVNLNGGVTVVDADTLVFSGMSNDPVPVPVLHRYTISTGAHAIISGVQDNNGLLAGLSPYVYFLAGSNSFWGRINLQVPAEYVAIAPLPVKQGAGASIAAAGGKIYFLGGGGSGDRKIFPLGSTPVNTDDKTFWEFDPAGSTRYQTVTYAGAWRQLTGTPAMVGANARLAYDGGGFIYAAQGGGSGLWRYSIPGADWEALSPFQAQAAGPLTFASDGHLYAITADTANSLHRFSPATGSWTAVAPTPGQVPLSIACPPGSDLIYCPRGGVDVWRYSISQGTFPFTLAQPPEPVGNSAAFADGGDGDGLYLMEGDGTLQRYSVGSDRWSPCAGIPEVAAGACLLAGGGDGFLYASFTSVSGGVWRYAVVDHPEQVGDTWIRFASHPIGCVEVSRIISSGPGRIHVLLKRGDGVRVLVPLDLVTGGMGSELPHPFPEVGELNGNGVYPSFLTSNIVHPAPGGVLYVVVVRDWEKLQLWACDIADQRWWLASDQPPFGDGAAGVAAFHCPTSRRLFGVNGWPGQKLVLLRLDGEGFVSPGSSLAELPGLFSGLFADPGNGPYLYAVARGDTRCFWRYRMADTTPPAPEQATLKQFHPGGTVELPIGGTVRETGFEVTGAFVAHPDWHTERALDVEARSLGTVPVVSRGASSWTLGQAVAVTVEGLDRGVGYAWRARIIDRRGGRSEWIEFSGNPDSEPDLRVRSNAAPQPGLLDQFVAADGGRIPTGGTVRERGDRIRLVATATDDDGDPIRLEFRILSADGGRVFEGHPAGGSYETVVTLTTGDYRWECRAADDLGATSGWIGHGGNGAGDADFLLRFLGGSIGGSFGCLQSSAAGLGSMAWLPLLLAIAIGVRR